MTQDQNYGYGNTSSLQGGDTDGGVTSNAIMSDLTVNPFIISAPSTTDTISKVLSGASSPHNGDCASVGSSGHGLSDETVTY